MHAYLGVFLSKTVLLTREKVGKQESATRGKLYVYFIHLFENRVMRRIFGPKRDEVPGEWRKLHNGELYNLYSPPDIIRQIKSRRMRWAGHVARMGEGRKMYRVLVGMPEGKRPLGRPRRRWEDGIKMDLREIGWVQGVWSGFTWLRIGTGGGLL
jgi:hypothetical protein